MYKFEVIVKQASGANLTLADKIKLVMLNSWGIDDLETIVEAHYGQPSFLGFANDITDRVIRRFPDTVKKKMRKDAKKQKPRFKTEADVIKQLAAEIASLFSNDKYPTLFPINTSGYALNRVLYCYAPEVLDVYFDSTLEYFIDGLDQDAFEEPAEVYRTPTPQQKKQSSLRDVILNVMHGATRYSTEAMTITLLKDNLYEESGDTFQFTVGARLFELWKDGKISRIRENNLFIYSKEPAVQKIVEPAIVAIPTEITQGGYVYTLSHKIEN